MRNEIPEKNHKQLFTFVVENDYRIYKVNSINCNYYFYKEHGPQYLMIYDLAFPRVFMSCKNVIE